MSGLTFLKDKAMQHHTKILVDSWQSVRGSYDLFNTYFPGQPGLEHRIASSTFIIDVCHAVTFCLHPRLNNSAL